VPTLTERLRAIVEPLPTGAAFTLPADVVRAWLEQEPAGAVAAPLAVAEPQTWRSRLWTCDAATLLNVKELAEALGRSPDAIYRMVSAKHAAAHGRDPLPAKRLDGVLTFTAAAVRRWLEASAVVVNPEPAGARLHVSRASRTA
jgi:predicted DNA-binding transcriptional regulator AlpA